MRTFRISLLPCSGISARPAWLGSHASTTFAYACTAVSGMTPTQGWMALAAEQYQLLSTSPRGLFYLNASMLMIPVQGYHRYVGPLATMQVRAAALLPVVDVAGAEEMTQGETVTMFNDMCVMAPATLIDSAIVWEQVDARTARASFTNAGYTIRAELSFNDAGK